MSVRVAYGSQCEPGSVVHSLLLTRDEVDASALLYTWEQSSEKPTVPEQNSAVPFYRDHTPPQNAWVFCW